MSLQFFTSITVAIPLGIKTSSDVPSSRRYKNITVCENALHKTPLVDNPAIDVCAFQNFTSFLKDKKSSNS